MTRDELVALRFACEYTLGQFVSGEIKTHRKSRQRGLEYRTAPQVQLLVRTLRQILKRWSNPKGEGEPSDEGVDV